MTRRECLDQAHRARSRGKIQRAIGLYEQALSSHPEDYETRARLAPLLVKARRTGDAWGNFAGAIEGYAGAGFHSKALSVAIQSMEQLPHRPESWTRVAQLYLEEGRREDAIDVLVRGRLQFRSEKSVSHALNVLHCLERIESSFPVRFDIASATALAGRKSEALIMLNRLQRAAKSRDERRLVHAALWRIRHNPVDLFRSVFGA